MRRIWGLPCLEQTPVSDPTFPSLLERFSQLGTTLDDFVHQDYMKPTNSRNSPIVWLYSVSTVEFVTGLGLVSNVSDI